MIRLNINLTTRTYIDTRRLNLFLSVIVLLLLLLLLHNSVTIARNAGTISQLQASLYNLAGKSGTPLLSQPSAKEYQELRSRLKSANEIIARKTFNWLKLLDELEMVVPEGVALSGIEPDIQKKELKISGAVRNFKELQRFVEDLESSKFFTEVFLTSHNAIQVGQTEKGINFAIACKVKL